MLADPEIEIIKEIITPEAAIQMRADGIVHVLYSKNVTLDVELQMKMFHLYKELTSNVKHPFVFSAMEGVVVTKEARDNAILIEDEAPVSAVAIIADTLAYRLIANFYLKVNKPKSPYKVFKKMDEALAWLQQFKVKA